MDKKKIEALEQEVDETHSIWWEFCEHMKQWYYNVQGQFDSSKMVGYKAIERVEEYITTHPEIKMIGVDDTYFSSSCLVIVPHPKMGLTVIYISQLSGNPNEFFLYHGHLQGLVSVLTELEPLTYSKYDKMLDDIREAKG